MKQFSDKKHHFSHGKTANKIKILKKKLELKKENPKKLKENTQKLKEILQKLKILTQKLPATKARWLIVPPICVQKKSLC